MQTIIMTEMLRATAKFQPNGQPIDSADGHRRALLEMKTQERQANASRKVLRTLRAKLVQIVAVFHFHNRTHHEVS